MSCTCNQYCVAGVHLTFKFLLLRLLNGRLRRLGCLSESLFCCFVRSWGCRCIHFIFLFSLIKFLFFILGGKAFYVNFIQTKWIKVILKHQKIGLRKFFATRLQQILNVYFTFELNEIEIKSQSIFKCLLLGFLINLLKLLLKLLLLFLFLVL